MRLLELFSGTGSIGRVFRAAGWEVCGVDLDPRAEADIYKNVLELTPAEVEEKLGGPPDFVWGSPPCIMYSMARTTAKTPRDFASADALVKRVLDLAGHWGCPFVFENPLGLLQTRPVVAGIPFARVDYCKYEDERFVRGYRKRTCLWHRGDFEPSRPLCRRDCGSSDGRRHKAFAQRGGAKRNGRRWSLDELHAMPPALCEDVEQYARGAIS